jgi:hypothetical protein
MTAQHDETQQRIGHGDISAGNAVNASDAVNDEPPPSYTIIENVPEKMVGKERTSCGGCLPERTAVLTILSVYFVSNSNQLIMRMYGRYYYNYRYVRMINHFHILIHTSVPECNIRCKRDRQSIG